MMDNVIEVPTTFDWLTRIIAAGVVVVFLAVASLVSRQPGLLVTLLCLVALLGVYAATLVPRGVAHLRLSPEKLSVKSWRGWRELAASDVARVTYVFNGRSPDFRLVGRDGSKLLVPTSTLADGHAQLLQWLSLHAPDAELDDKSSQVRAMLEAKGLVY